jgi:hypothetical protein
LLCHDYLLFRPDQGVAIKVTMNFGFTIPAPDEFVATILPVASSNEVRGT